MKARAGLKTFGITFSLAIFCSMASAADASRDWNKHPAVLQLTTNEDVFAIGDPHGDPDRLAGVLLAAGLIAAAPSAPDQVKWAGGKSVLVIVGDLIDKGGESLEVIALLRKLQSDAASHGGRVIILMGNHEAEFLAEPNGKKTKEFFTELKTAGQNPTDVANCNGDLGQFLCSLPIAVRMNDWFFSHGGNTKNRTIAELSAAIEAGFSQDGFASTELIGDDSILEARLNKKGPGGLPWFYNGNSAIDPQRLLAKYVKKLGVRHLVQGHQPGKVKFPDGRNREEGSFFQRYGLLFLIDSGMSRGIEDSESTGGALRIRNGKKATIICANGTQKMLWDKKTNSDHRTKDCGDKP
jgi:calcineurin-like phosphoesterase family protein